MDRDLTALLHRLADARGIPFRRDVLPERRRFASWDGVELSYLDWRGEGPEVVLLHGGALTSHTFDLVALALSDRYRCVALDLRGHGHSGWSDDYAIAASARDVVALLDHLAMDQAHVAGMSLGGCVAGHAAVLAPERMASLAFIDVGPKVDFEASAGMRGFIGATRPAERIDDVVRAALAASPRTDPDLMVYRYRTLMKPSPEGWILRQDRRRPNDYPHILGRLAALWDHAPALSFPVLVARGGRSRILAAEDAAAFAARLPRGRWTEIEGAGHNVQEDNPVALAAALGALMAEGDVGGS